MEMRKYLAVVLSASLLIGLQVKAEEDITKEIDEIVTEEIDKITTEEVAKVEEAGKLNSLKNYINPHTVGAAFGGAVLAVGAVAGYLYFKEDEVVKVCESMVVADLKVSKEDAKNKAAEIKRKVAEAKTEKAKLEGDKAKLDPNKDEDKPKIKEAEGKIKVQDEIIAKEKKLAVLDVLSNRPDDLDEATFNKLMEIRAKEEVDKVTNFYTNLLKSGAKLHNKLKNKYVKPAPKK